MNDLQRIQELEAEMEVVHARLSDRAAEWYRIASGRTHFHPLQYLGTTGNMTEWYTPIRSGNVHVDIPVYWFNEA